MRKYIGKIVDVPETVEKLGNKCPTYFQYMRSQNVTRYHIRMERTVSAVNFMLQLYLDLSVLANSNSEESKWMAAGICFLSLLYWAKATVHLVHFCFDIAKI